MMVAMDVGPMAIERNRELWELVNARFTDADADLRWNAAEITWGLFQHREDDLDLLGHIAGLDVVEIGCGSAYLSAALVRAGARPVALDLSPAQLATARRCQRDHGLSFPLVEANGEQLPLKGGSVDLVVSEYGAGPWCDPSRWIPEAARLLRPGGRLVFLTHSVLAAMCVPADPGPAGDHLLRPQRDVNPIAWLGGGVEHHPGHGEWISVLRGRASSSTPCTSCTPRPTSGSTSTTTSSTDRGRVAGPPRTSGWHTSHRPDPA